MANTILSVLTSEAREAIAAKLLVTPNHRWLFAEAGGVEQGAPEANEKGATTIRYVRPTLYNSTYTEASRRVAEDTDITSASQAMAATDVVGTTREYGGPYTGSAITPIGVREFAKRHSQHDLIEWLGNLLVADRAQFLDRVFMDMYLASANVQTVDGAAEGSILISLPMTVVALRALAKQMKDAKVPQFPNGRWRLILSTQDEAKLMADADFKEACRYLNKENPAFSGVIAEFAGFDIGVSTHLPTKMVGASSLVVGYQSVAFGPLGLGHGVSMPPETRVDANDDFGRKERVIWLAHEHFATLYPALIFRTISTAL